MQLYSNTHTHTHTHTHIYFSASFQDPIVRFASVVKVMRDHVFDVVPIWLPFLPNFVKIGPTVITYEKI